MGVVRRARLGGAQSLSVSFGSGSAIAVVLTALDAGK